MIVNVSLLMVFTFVFAVKLKMNSEPVQLVNRNVLSLILNCIFVVFFHESNFLYQRSVVIALSSFHEESFANTVSIGVHTILVLLLINLHFYIQYTSNLYVGISIVIQYAYIELRQNQWISGYLVQEFVLLLMLLCYYRRHSQARRDADKCIGSLISEY